ncbi:hypothetical protein Acr_06g0013220 [Actinidia rufa]|uniref:C3H1-type domain-containing protein n=1 Tax=Actinidia rufa TaxID=165716 RepID=A0A7J0ESR0_9ERIC|nr:hypothetical protein Acr_06g0013220 [Actinidia rufa]
MEGPYGNDSSRVSKLKAFNGNVLTINSQRDNHQFYIGGGRLHHPPKSPTLDPYSENLDSALIRYLRSGSPVAGDPFKAPVAGAMIRPIKLGDSAVEVAAGVQDASEGGGGRAGDGRHSGRICVRWEDEVVSVIGFQRIVVFVFGEQKFLQDGNMSVRGRIPVTVVMAPNARFPMIHVIGEFAGDHASAFAHGKEEVRPLRFPTRSKSEAQTCKSYSSSGTCSYGSKCRFAHHQVMTAAISPTGPSVLAATLATTQIISPIETENSSESSSKSMSSGNVTVTFADWSPLDDGIEVSLPPSASTNEIPSREAVDAYINSVRYGPSRGKRLPVFAEICPE